MLSSFLKSKKKECKELVLELKKHFKYVSILGTDVVSKRITADKMTSNISESDDSECGFVLKMTNGGSFFEYSLDDISGDIASLAKRIISSLNISSKLSEQMIKGSIPTDKALIKSFERKSDYDEYTDEKILKQCIDIKDKLLTLDSKILNAYVGVMTMEVSKIFISENKDLDQYYTWGNGMMVLIYGDNNKIVQPREVTYSNNISECLNPLEKRMDKIIDKAKHLYNSKPIIPGYYDVITDASITGLIAHEAFGHGVEMDQFVKDRALAKNFVGKSVASSITNMKDGAASGLSAASYFFDDDGVLAHDTQIIKDGILVSGISDLVSATELGTEPTGNGRRESFKRKAYSRMTNTFFEKGTDKLEDMIKSIKHGYFLFETNNGMEDPKNWAIQCTAEYGIEIIDGKLTDNYVSPVVMSGYVPDLLKSISMISDEFELEGAGFCGKGYKEWVRVSSGGAHLKAKVKLS
ncbi:MAG: TldD/PmbA family protein [Anaeroplasma sp.]